MDLSAHAIPFLIAMPADTILHTTRLWTMHAPFVKTRDSWVTEYVWPPARSEPLPTDRESSVANAVKASTYPLNTHIHIHIHTYTHTHTRYDVYISSETEFFSRSSSRNTPYNTIHNSCMHKVRASLRLSFLLKFGISQPKIYTIHSSIQIQCRLMGVRRI